MVDPMGARPAVTTTRKTHATSRWLGVACPRCGKPIAEGERTLRCPYRYTAHHIGCWHENMDRCTKDGTLARLIDSPVLSPPLGADAFPRYLVVVLRPRLTLGLYGSSPAGEIEASQTVYRDAGYGSVVGLYDWLRTQRGTWTGMATHFVKDGPYVLRDVVRNLDYVSFPDRRHSMEIYFHRGEPLGPIQTDAVQAFGENRILVSAGGEYALTFDLNGWLREGDLETLRRVDADWIHRT